MTSSLHKITQAAFASALSTVLVALAACSSDHTDSEPAHSADAVARVGNAVLTRTELQRATPANLSQSDSTAFADAYVRTWISDQLITEIAINHVPDLSEIDRLTNDYRRNLIMWQYRTRMVESDTTLQVTEADMRKYYDEHPAEMKLRHPMLRGIYVKIESDSPDLRKVERLYKSMKPDDIEELEKVELHGAIHYDYFRDRWIPWEQIVTKIPEEIAESSLHAGYSHRFDSDGFTYLLSVSEILPAGTKMPFDAAKPRISEVLQAIRLTKIDEELRRRLYLEAQSSDQIQIY